MYGLWGIESRGVYSEESHQHSLSVSHKQSDGYIANSDYKLTNLLWQSQLKSDNGKLNVMLRYNDKRFGANTFYAAAYPNQYDDTQSWLVAVRGETRGKLNLMPQIYWHRHADTYHLFRPGTPDIPQWYKSPNYHLTDVLGLALRGKYAWQGGLTVVGAEFRNEGIVSNNLGRLMAQPTDKYTKFDNRSALNLFLEHTLVWRNLTLSAGGMLSYNTSLVETENALAFIAVR